MTQYILTSPVGKVPPRLFDCRDLKAAKKKVWESFPMKKGWRLTWHQVRPGLHVLKVYNSVGDPQPRMNVNLWTFNEYRKTNMPHLMMA